MLEPYFVYVWVFAYRYSYSVLAVGTHTCLLSYQFNRIEHTDSKLHISLLLLNK